MPKVAFHRSEPWPPAVVDRDVRSVLILRSCRPAVLADAVRHARARYPSARITALTHRGHTATLGEMAVDSVEEIRGRRFGLLRVAPWTMARLRRRRFDVVIVPQMTADFDANANLHRFVAALGAPRVVVLPGEQAPVMFRGRAFLHFAFWNSCTERCDAPLLLLMLLAACLAPRPRSAPTGRARRRVLCVISHLGVGGAQVQLAQLLNRLPADQYEVDLLVLSRSDDEFSRPALARGDIDVSYLSDWPRLAHSVREVMIRCQERRYDLVHTWLFLANVVGAAAARLAGVPLVVASVRNLSVWKREAWYRKWWHRAADVLASRAADVVTVNARALVDDHARWALLPRHRIEVVHNGLDPARLTFGRGEGRLLLQHATSASPGSVFVGTIGRLAHEKDQATFLRILADVRASRPDVHGVVIGDGDRRSSLQQLARELRLTNGVSFLGARPDARQLAAGLDLFVLTSRSEGFPNVLLEATLLGVPCVATDIAGNPDVVDREECLFPPGDVRRGSERVRAALADAAMTRRRAEELRERAMTLFNAERSVGAWLEVYQRRFAASVPGGSSVPAQALIQAETR